VIWRNPKTTVALDITIQNEPTIINQHRFNAFLFVNEIYMKFLNTIA
jgi:hypothetical protein